MAEAGSCVSQQRLLSNGSFGNWPCGVIALRLVKPRKLASTSCESFPTDNGRVGRGYLPAFGGCRQYARKRVSCHQMNIPLGK